MIKIIIIKLIMIQLIMMKMMKFMQIKMKYQILMMYKKLQNKYKKKYMIIIII